MIKVDLEQKKSLLNKLPWLTVYVEFLKLEEIDFNTLTAQVLDSVPQSRVRTGPGVNINHSQETWLITADDRCLDGINHAVKAEHSEPNALNMDRPGESIGMGIQRVWLTSDEYPATILQIEQGHKIEKGQSVGGYILRLWRFREGVYNAWLESKIKDLEDVGAALWK